MQITFNDSFENRIEIERFLEIKSCLLKSYFKVLIASKRCNRKRRRTIVQLNLLLNNSRQQMKKKLIVNDECLNSEFHFLNHIFYFIYFFFFIEIRRYTFYISHQISLFHWSFIKMSSSFFVLFCLHRFFICSSIQFTRVTQHYSRYSSKCFNLIYSIIFDWIIIININHCINSWRKTINYTWKWSKLLWHDCRALTSYSITW